MSSDFSINIVAFFRLIDLISTFINFNFFHFAFRIFSIHSSLRSFFSFLHSKSTCLIVCLSRWHEHMRLSIAFLLYKNVCKSILIVRSCIAIALCFFVSLSWSCSIDLLDFVIIEYNVLSFLQFLHSSTHCCCTLLFIVILIALFNIHISCVCEAIWLVFISFCLSRCSFSLQFVICLTAIFVFSLLSMSTWVDIQCSFISMFLRRSSSISRTIHFIRYWSKLIFEL